MQLKAKNNSIFLTLCTLIIQSAYGQIILKDELNSERLSNRAVLLNNDKKIKTNDFGEIKIEDLLNGNIVLKVEGYEDYIFYNDATNRTLFLTPTVIKLDEVVIKKAKTENLIEIGYISLASKKKVKNLAFARTDESGSFGVILDLPFDTHFVLQNLMFGCQRITEQVSIKASVWAINEKEKSLGSKISEVEGVATWDNQKKAYILDISEKYIIVNEKQFVLVLDEINNKKEYQISVLRRSSENQPNRTVIVNRYNTLFFIPNGFYVDPKGNQQNLRMGATIVQKEFFNTD